MNRIDRLTAILIQLQTKKVVKGQEIADRFSISLRTVYRDIRALEEAGIPIGAEAGVGYFLHSDYHLPPVLFTKEEASAFILAGKLVGSLSDSHVSSDFENALFKIKSVLKNSDKDYLENLEPTIAVFNNRSFPCKEQDLHLQDIQKALVSKNVLEMEYYAIYNQQLSIRKIEPLSLCHYDMNWHLIAFCRKRKEYRDFRLDRIKKLNVQTEQFNPDLHISLTEYFEKMGNKNDLYRIQLQVESSFVTDLGSVKYWYGLIEEKEIGDKVQLTFAYHDLQLFAKWILSLGNMVQILQPEELKEIVKENVRVLKEHYT